jgi:hypothetical protein
VEPSSRARDARDISLPQSKGTAMRSLLLWILGVPISLIVIIGLLTHF